MNNLPIVWYKSHDRVENAIKERVSSDKDFREYFMRGGKFQLVEDKGFSQKFKKNIEKANRNENEE